MRKAFQHLVLLLLLVSGSTFAGSQIEEPLSNSVKAMMQRSISDKAAPRLVFATLVLVGGAILLSLLFPPKAKV